MPRAGGVACRGRVDAAAPAPRGPRGGTAGDPAVASATGRDPDGDRGADEQHSGERDLGHDGRHGEGTGVARSGALGAHAGPDGERAEGRWCHIDEVALHPVGEEEIDVVLALARLHPLGSVAQVERAALPQEVVVADPIEHREGHERPGLGRIGAGRRRLHRLDRPHRGVLEVVDLVVLDAHDLRRVTGRVSPGGEATRPQGLGLPDRIVGGVPVVDPLVQVVGGGVQSPRLAGHGVVSVSKWAFRSSRVVASTMANVRASESRVAASGTVRSRL